MKIQKRDGQLQEFEGEKIAQAIRKAFSSTGTLIEESVLKEIIEDITKAAAADKPMLSVEVVQDLVEEELMQHQFYKEAKNYILYRQKRTESRKVVQDLVHALQKEDLYSILADIQQRYPDEGYDLRHLLMKFHSFLKEDMESDERLHMLMKASVELISKEAPKWEYIASRFLSYALHEEISARMQKLELPVFSKKLKYLEEQGYYGDYIRKAYSDAEIDELGAYLKDERDYLFTYSGLELVKKRYLMCSHAHEVLETPQEMFMGIAMHLALPEQNRMYWAKQIYDILSQLQVTMATPTMSNARKPYHQLSSCFIDTVPDSLEGIYRSVDNFAQVSKFGGGMGLYFGKVRAAGSRIRGFEGAAGGVIRWIKLVNDTAVAVDQLGMRQGAAAVYLDAWHKDLPEFLQLRTNNGDDRMKAHDIFPAVCFPDLFWRMAKENLDQDWHLMCPHEIQTVKGYCLEDCYGELWEERYLDCVEDDRISKRTVLLKDVARLIIKSAVETGTPFIFNRDTVNRANPNSHRGIIYCSNLCTEIAQNMSPIESVSTQVLEVNGETTVVQTTRPGDFVVCNLASLCLGAIDVDDPGEVEHIVASAVRALDNVIDLNFYPLAYAGITNQNYRGIGLGVSGYHHMLAKHGIRWESGEHLAFADRVFERIHYAAVRASANLAAEKGRYRYFEGSEWQTGAYFEKRGLVSGEWKELAGQVAEHGMRNAYLLAVAPTSSTSILSGTTAGLDPVMKRFYLEEKKNAILPRVAPDLTPRTFWLYKSGYTMDQTWTVRAAGVRQRHIDQAQSVNLYITNDYTMRQLLNLYILAWESGVKTLYYVRSKSLEVEECESCSS